MKKIAMITGATGFIGANLTYKLCYQGHEVHLLLRPDCTRWRIDHLDVDVHEHQVDFLDQKSLTQTAARIQPDWVFHLAVYGAYSYQANLDRMVETNIKGTINLVRACLESGFDVFVNTGSSSEYGFKHHASREENRIDPNSHYAICKATGTMFCRYTARSEKVRIPTLRLYSAYGPYEAPGRLIPMLIIKGLRNSLPPLVNPTIARDFVYINDVTNAYILAATTPTKDPGAIFNVGTGVQTTIREAVEIARTSLNIKTDPKWDTMPNRLWDTNSWVANPDKIKSELGWQPKVTFMQGFNLMADWFRSDKSVLALYNATSA